MNKPKKSTVLYKNGLIKCVLQNTKEIVLFNDAQEVKECIEPSQIKIDTVKADGYDGQSLLWTSETHLGIGLNKSGVAKALEYFAPFFMQCMINQEYECEYPSIILSFNNEQKTIRKIRVEIEKA